MVGVGKYFVFLRLMLTFLPLSFPGISMAPEKNAYMVSYLFDVIFRRVAY